MKSIVLILLGLALVGCNGGTPADTQAEHRNRAMLEHNDVSLDLQKAWGSKPRSESERTAQRQWETKMQSDCHPADGGQIGSDLNAIYCEINAMKERSAALRGATLRE